MYLHRSLAAALLGAGLLAAQDSSWLPPGLIHLLTPSERTRAGQAPPSEREALLATFFRTRNRAEFERRVAQANARFATDAKAGWQTDRGRIYIQQGPPDEIYSLPRGTATSDVPSEQWRYNWNDGSSDSFDYRFLDPGRKGDFQLILQAARRADRLGQYNAWISEDVHYIAEVHERTAFMRLHTDEERDNFIEQFWLRRDPDPATEINEFKNEHYRRIAYANNRYAANGQPGWRSDRGRIYIEHGPPDEIEVVPNSSEKEFSYERWLYRQAVRKSFTFRGPLLDMVLSTAEKPN